MREPLYVLNIASRPLGQLIGGKYDVSIECPVCKRPAVLHRSGRRAGTGVLFKEYAHRISIDLNEHNEPVARASEICIAIPRDPSREPKSGGRGSK